MIFTFSKIIVSTIDTTFSCNRKKSEGTSGEKVLISSLKMRFAGIISLASAAMVVLGKDIEVYKFPYRVAGGDTPRISGGDALLNLANQFDISDSYSLDSLSSESILEIGQDGFFEEKSDVPQKELIVVVEGVVSDLQVDAKPIFTVSKDLKFNHFIQELPEKFAEKFETNKLSNEIIVVQKSSNSWNSKWNQMWNHYFQYNKEQNNKLKSIWDDLKEKFHLAVPGLEERYVDLINDESFISEMSQFKFLIEDSDLLCDKVVIHLKSLSNILKKTGYSSMTYQNSLKIMSNLINQNLINNLNQNFKTTLIVIPTVSSFQKRLDSSTSASGNCFVSEESCLVSTSSCSNHGVCSKVGDCWSCNCAASFDETTRSTTYWQGSDCSKKDVSVEFNLFLWFSVFMIIATTLGVKLLFDVGNQELPGVLGAATALKKSNA